MVPNIQKYVKGDHHDRDQNIEYMIKFCFLCGHDGLSTISMTFLDLNGGVYVCLRGYFIILSGFMVQNIQKYITGDHDASQGGKTLLAMSKIVV